MTLQHWIDDLRRLEKAATPGDWLVDRDERRDGAHQVIAPYSRSPDGTGTICFMAHGWSEDADDANPALIAAARNALPLLLDVAEADVELREAEKAIALPVAALDDAHWAAVDRVAAATARRNAALEALTAAVKESDYA